MIAGMINLVVGVAFVVLAVVFGRVAGEAWTRFDTGCFVAVGSLLATAACVVLAAVFLLAAGIQLP